MAKEDIALALRNARLKAKMTCKEVAEKIGKSEKTISAWEHCNGQPDADNFLLLCEIYNVSSINELIGESLRVNLEQQEALQTMYFHLGKEAQDMGISQNDIDLMLQFFRQHKINNEKK